MSAAKETRRTGPWPSQLFRRKKRTAALKPQPSSEPSRFILAYRWFYIMPGGIWGAPIGASFCGISAIKVSVVKSKAAMEEAFCKA